jgi:hypothetical protein
MTSLTDLQLPEELKGPWEHAVLLTYGADLPFFERTLSRQLPATCRNRVVLADPRQYLEACIRFAKGGLVRTLNQHYVGDGVHFGIAMHAKVILLASPTDGRLLVGSGNLNLSGYASGGELFTKYEYAAAARNDLGAFVSVRRFLERLVDADAVGTVSVTRVQHLLERTPWLFEPAEADLAPIRHNLDRAFIDQLAAEAAGREVDELIVSAPFYDADTAALEELVDRLQPTAVRVLVQPGQTSVDPLALDRVASAHARFEVVPFTKRDDDVYVHAKLILIKTGDDAICLQGSPNISRVALLRHGANANVEVANLLRGARNDFDDILAGLALGSPASSATTLELRHDPDDAPRPELAGWHLTRGSWSGDRLTLQFSGDSPVLDGATLLVGEMPFDLAVVELTRNQMVIRLDSAAQELLTQARPVAIGWPEAAGTWRSNPIFPFNVVALQRVLEAAAGTDRLPWVGSLDELDDEELEQLLHELADSVVIDNQSLWRLAGRGEPPPGDDENARIAYAEIDYEALKQHPKLRQYAAGFGSGGGAQQSRLQIILRSIASNFAPVHQGVPVRQDALSAIDEAEAETEEELELEAEERERRRSTLEAHLRRIFQNFIRRYLKGATSREFEDRVGSEVIAHNYVIFSFILWRLFRKPWMPVAFLVEALLDTWKHFWSRDAERPGFVARLEATERERAIAWLREQHADAQLFASIYYASFLTAAENLTALRLALRDFLRDSIKDPLIPLHADVAADAARTISRLLPGRPPTPGELTDELRGLLDFETRSSFLSTVDGQASFEDVSVVRPALRREVRTPCLVLAEAVDERTMLELLARWMRFEDRDYYRVQSAESRAVCFYDAVSKEGVSWAGANSEPRSFGAPPSVIAPWDEVFNEYFRLSGDEGVAEPTQAAS